MPALGNAVVVDEDVDLAEQIERLVRDLLSAAVGTPFLVVSDQPASLESAELLGASECVVGAAELEAEALLARCAGLLEQREALRSRYWQAIEQVRANYDRAVAAFVASV